MSITFVRAWDNGHSELGGHWIRQGSAGRMDDTLDALMSVDRVIRVHDDGTVTDKTSGVYAPEVDIDLDADGQIPDATERQMIDEIKRAGWDVQSGWSGQYRYGGPIMHESEFVGGPLAEHVLSTPGFWVVTYPSVTVSHCPDEEDRCEQCTYDMERRPDRWLILHRDAVWAELEAGATTGEPAGS